MGTNNRSQSSYLYSGNGAKEFNRLADQAKFYLQEELTSLQQLGLKPDSKCLDAGCGPGFVTKFLSAAVPDGHIHGIEIEPVLANVAAETCKGLGNVSIHQGSVYDIPDEARNADFIYSRLVFSHLAQPREALASFKTALKPGGTAVVTDVDDGLLMTYPGIPELEALLIESSDLQRKHSGDREIGRKLGSMFRDAGFKNVEAHCKIVPINSASSLPLLDIYIGGRLDYVSEFTRNKFQTSYAEVRDRITAGSQWVYVPLFYAFGNA